MAEYYHTKPSEILGISNPLHAYVIDLNIIAERAREAPAEEPRRKSTLEKIREKRRRWFRR